MKKLLIFGLLGLGFIGCDPNIPGPSGSGSNGLITALFDPAQTPPLVPTPTDLAMGANGLVNIPIAANASPAQRELVSYLNTLDGYAADTPARAGFNGILDASTVNANTVRVFSLGSPRGLAANASISVSLAGGGTQLNIAPPLNGWIPGNSYGVAIIGGSNGIKGARGEMVVGSSTFLLARSTTSLVTGCTNPVLSNGQCNPDCRTVTDAIPSGETDPSARLAEQSCSAARLELLRRGYSQFFSFLESQTISRSDVALVWTFKIATHPTVTFDPANQVIPFPNNAVLGPPPAGGGRPLVNLSVPDGSSALTALLYQGLNTLDGFSTTAPIVSQNSTQLGSLSPGDVDPASVTAATVGFVRLPSAPDAGPGHTPTAPQITACVSCVPNLLLDGGTPSLPTQLMWVPSVPLDERTTYGVFVTTGVKDTNGLNAIASTPFALARLANPIFDGTRSTVDLISDDQARRLEPLRAGLKSFIDIVERQVGGRNNIALAWAFTTQSEVSTLKVLRDLPSGIPSVPADPLYVAPSTAAPVPPAPSNFIRNVYGGEILVPVLLSPAGPFGPTPMPTKIPFLLVTPNTATGAVPVVIFGHGLQGNRTHMLQIANAFAGAGMATIATDVVWHGMRSTCVGFAAATGLPSDDYACGGASPNPGSQRCDVPTGRCFSRGSALACPGPAGDQTCLDANQGFCVSGMCEGGSFVSTPPGTTPAIVVSGWNFLNVTNLFATRDNLRQQVIDLAQLVRMLKSTTGTRLNVQLGLLSSPVTINGDQIHYAGQSLGGILGTLFASVSHDVNNVELNVPGGDLVNILLTSPAFLPVRSGFLATLANQTPAITPGTLAFAQFIGIAKWILDPADPQNMGFSLLNGSDLPPTPRKAVIHYISDDQTVPNLTTQELILAASRGGGTSAPDLCQDTSNTIFPLDRRHGFLLNFADSTRTTLAQTYAATYLSAGSATCPP